MLNTQLSYIITVAILACGPIASAGIITLPTGMNPGDQYRLMFVTSGTRDAASLDIQDYNSFVTNQANQSSGLMALGTDWKAVASTLLVNAIDNTGTNPLTMGVPIYNLAGLIVAGSNSDLWDGGLHAPILYDQTGIGLSDASVWTGTLTHGRRDIELFLGEIFVITGSPGTTTTQWIEGQANSSVRSHHLYAISGVITVVPEPRSLLMVGLGTCVASSTRLRRNKKT